LTAFYDVTPTLDSRWRAIVLFGRNVASYKFALASSLLELKPQSPDILRLEDLAVPFSRAVCDHLKLSDKQGTSGSSRFIEACRAFNRGEILLDVLTAKTVQLGFNNVIDAFHIVGGGEVGVKFFLDEREASGGIRLTDDFWKLRDLLQARSLGDEVQSRWRLVETAWTMGLATRLIEADAASGNLFVSGARRVAVTSSRGALNGYQKGRCFYCFREIALDAGPDLSPDVDHFFPWKLGQVGHNGLDGIWNLVLACRDCNRGKGGKSDRLPTLELLNRLHIRNSYLIDSHHPLRETLIAQTGDSEAERKSFLQSQWNLSRSAIMHTWEPEALADPTF
jgi:hypothetical protein